jgi:hypothetical protein
MAYTDLFNEAFDDLCTTLARSPGWPLSTTRETCAQTVC